MLNIDVFPVVDSTPSEPMPPHPPPPPTPGEPIPDEPPEPPHPEPPAGPISSAPPLCVYQRDNSTQRPPRRGLISPLAVLRLCVRRGSGGTATTGAADEHRRSLLR